MNSTPFCLFHFRSYYH